MKQNRERRPRLGGEARPSRKPRWVVGALAASARTTEERVGTCGSFGTESNLAIGHDQNLGGLNGGLGLSGKRDRLLNEGNRGLASLATLPHRRRARRGGTGRARTTAPGQSFSQLDADHGQRHAVHFPALSGDAGATRHHASPHRLSSPGRQKLHRTVPETQLYRESTKM